MRVPLVVGLVAQSIVTIVGIGMPTRLSAKEIMTNGVSIPSAPDWLAQTRVERVVRRVERALEWDLRKVQVHWISDAEVFQKMHGFGPSVVALTKRPELSVVVGPQMDQARFDEFFGHEIGHVILSQKYGASIPAWLDEGLATWAAGNQKNPNYAALQAEWQALSVADRDVRKLKHPFGGGAAGLSPAGHYAASTAVVKMLSSRCSIVDLLQLSVGRSLESYLATFCGVADLNGEFLAWLRRQTPASRGGEKPAPVLPIGKPDSVDR